LGKSSGRIAFRSRGLTPRRRGDSARRVQWPEQGEAEARSPQSIIPPSLASHHSRCWRLGQQPGDLHREDGEQHHHGEQRRSWSRVPEQVVPAAWASGDGGEAGTRSLRKSSGRIPSPKAGLDNSITGPIRAGAPAVELSSRARQILHQVVAAGTTAGGEIRSQLSPCPRLLPQDRGAWAVAAARNLLAAYLDRRLPRWREDAQGDAATGSGPARSGKMTKDEADQVLGGLLEVSCQRGTRAGHGEHVARRRADHLPVLRPNPIAEAEARPCPVRPAADVG
jgi:hypothetical protein